MMNQEESKKQKPIPERLEAIRDLPESILKTLTKEEVKAFLYDDSWPDSLQEKLKRYTVNED